MSSIIRPDDAGLKVPHMGWNTLNPRRDHPIMDGIALGEQGLHAYFVHSFQFVAPREAVLADTRYGGTLTAMVGRDNMVGTQFHPEKSQKARPGADRQFPAVGAMILYPAIDLKDGQCVRLVHGDMQRATVFNVDPAAQARAFALQGFDHLHVVDLDGAFAGKPMNARAVEAILAATTMPVQLGGGIRDIRTVAGWLDAGIARVIIGTAAVRDPDLVREAARLYPGRIAVGIDARDGTVAVEGWAKTSTITATALGRRFEDAGVAALIYTDISRDGALKGLNIETTLALADAVIDPGRRLRRPRVDRGRAPASRSRLHEARRRDQRSRAL